MNQNPLVSVVIPTYNNASRIALTLEAIIAQDYANLEIILVNDCSSDKTLEISRELLSRSNRKFKIITLDKNSGESVARNTGIANSSGEYIWFCDGDDLSKENLVSKLLSSALKYDSDIAFGGCVNRYDDVNTPDETLPVKIPAQVMTGEEALYLRVFKKISPLFCSALYKLEFLVKNNLRFEPGCSAGQDVEFQMKTFCRAAKISCIQDCVYIYVHHSGMGQVRDRNTPEKTLRRYTHNTQAHFRVAEYLSQHAQSRRISNIAKNLLLPEALIRQFTIFSRAADWENFASLRSRENLGILLRSGKYLLKKPEVFLKALAIICLPKIYYKLRRN